ncbi:MAG: DUF4145 domain-containing protein [Anaerolineae bacterium]
MRKSEERILERLDELIDLGNQVLETRKYLQQWRKFKIGDHQLLSQWLTSSLNFVSRVIGSNSDYYLKFRWQAELTEDWRQSYDATNRCQGILLAAREDIISGFLFDRELLISADVFDDFLEQAEHLLENKYKDAAAVLIESVLESSLRKMCKKHGVDVADGTGTMITDTATIAPLNDALYKGKVYPKLVHKKIIVWADVRNNAAHGHYDQYTQSDVEDMDKWVRSFVTERLT